MRRRLRPYSARCCPTGATYRSALKSDPGRPMFVDGENLADLPYVPSEMMAVLRRAMAHDPRERYQSAAQLRSALAALSADR